MDSRWGERIKHEVQGRRVAGNRRRRSRHRHSVRRLGIEDLEQRRLLAVTFLEGEDAADDCGTDTSDSGGSCNIGGSTSDTVPPEVVRVEVAAADRIDVVFTEAMNADSLITGGTIIDAVVLTEITQGNVSLTPEQFSYLDEVLSLTFDEPLAEGDYQVNLDGDLLQDMAGNALRGNSATGTVPFEDAVLVQAAGADIHVEAYSTPSLADWNDDGVQDLIVGEKTSGDEGKIRVYLNEGTAQSPQYSGYFYAQADGVDLAVSGSGCLGVFPRLADWDGDGRPDLVLGLADGRVQIALNQNTAAAPQFGAPTTVTVGEPGSKTDLDVGYRATVAAVDWNNDQRLDLAVGGLDGNVRVVLNESDLGAPDFRSVQTLQDGTADLAVLNDRASIAVADLDGDGDKDLISGNTAGQIVFYSNIGSDDDPQFDGYQLLDAGQFTIDLDGSPRSRPDVTDANGDGVLDLLVGAQDGLVRLFPGSQSNATGGDYVHSFQIDAPAWQCPAHPLDVNGDDWITAQDVLIVINYINAHGSGPVPDGVPSSYFYDCTGDAYITAIDVLLVVNDLNANGSHAIDSQSGGSCPIGGDDPGCSGEGEAGQIQSEPTGSSSVVAILEVTREESFASQTSDGEDERHRIDFL